MKLYFSFIGLRIFTRFSMLIADEVWAVPSSTTMGENVHCTAVGGGSLIIGGKSLISINFDPDSHFWNLF